MFRVVGRRPTCSNVHAEFGSVAHVPSMPAFVFDLSIVFGALSFSNAEKEHRFYGY